LTFLPGVSVVPDADLDRFRTCKSSIHTIAWFWLMVAVNSLYSFSDFEASRNWLAVCSVC